MTVVIVTTHFDDESQSSTDMVFLYKTIILSPQKNRTALNGLFDKWNLLFDM